MRLFAQSLDENTYAKEEEEMKLHIRAQMPLGGSVHELNEKVQILETVREPRGMVGGQPDRGIQG